jgi:hypothetical protein
MRFVDGHDPTWSLQQQALKQVAREDAKAWALRPTPPFKPIAPLPDQRWRPTPLRVFLSSIMP